MAKEGSVVGGILLIAGSCIGAGMLGLPIQTGISGFTPSLFLFFLSCLFMTTTALLLIEVNGWFPHRANLLTMAKNTVGPIGKHVCWITYLFLFYALLVAYISGCGNLSTTILQNSFSISLPVWVSSLFFALLFGSVVYFGTRGVDLFNRFLMVGKIGFFVLFVLLGIQYVQPAFLTRSNPEYAISSLPLLIIAFGFHNIIPSLTSYFKGNLKRVRITILGGSSLAFLIYLIWQTIVLGIIPLEGENGLLWSFTHDQEASQAIAAIIASPSVKIFSQGLGFFALLTSFLAQTLSLVHFLSDAMKVTYKKRENINICLLALLPPLIFSLIYPNLFFKALNFAGGICAVILFGILPVCMVWVGRYRKNLGTSTLGGKPVLALVFLSAIFILFVQLSSMTGLNLFPSP